MYLKYVGIRVTDLERSVKFYSGERIELNWYPPESEYALRTRRARRSITSASS